MEISELFERYTAAFNDLDAVAIANCYSIPCGTIDGDGKQVFSDRHRLIQKFAENCQAMAEIDYKHASYTIVDVLDLGLLNKAVNIHWQVQTANATMEFGSMYMCSLEAKKWQIFSVCVYTL